ncbi:hypothetical protein F4861DRAFT_516014 [Xylaria intraflava]|nr:hypothetical protein F4861DRAFT_516014 [Xylaria intraflava]
MVFCLRLALYSVPVPAALLGSSRISLHGLGFSVSQYLAGLADAALGTQMKTALHLLRCCSVAVISKAFSGERYIRARFT